MLGTSGGCGGGHDSCSGGQMSQDLTTFHFIKGQTECKKCKEALAAVCLRRKDCYCEKCFLTATAHKFRANLGKNRLARSGEKALALFDGSLSAKAMLALLAERDGENRGKRLMMTTEVLILDDYSPFVQDSAERTRLVKDLAVEAGCGKVHLANLDMALNDDSQPVRIQSEDDVKCSTSADIRALLDQVKEITAKESFYDQLRRRAIVNAARRLKVSMVLTPETSSALAVRLMTGLATGRGRHLPHDVGLTDEREGDLTLVTAMRDFSDEEMEAFCGLKNLGAPAKRFTFGRGHLASIGQLTESFVLGLQVTSYL